MRQMSDEHSSTASEGHKYKEGTHLHVIHWQVNTLHCTIHRKDLHEVIPVNITGEAANVDPGWSGCGGTRLPARPW